MQLTRRSFLMLTPAAAYAADWNSFRGPQGSGVADGAPLPVECDIGNGRNVLWKTEIPGLGHSSPVIARSRLYLTTAMPEQATFPYNPGVEIDVAKDQKVPHRWNVLALDLSTGKNIWTRTACEGAPRIQRHFRASHANSTPAVDGRHIAVFLGPEGLYVYNTEGKLIWKKDLGLLTVGLKGRPEVEWGWSSSPVLAGNILVVQCDTHREDFVAAFDVDSGKELWRSPREEDPGWCTPLVTDTPKGTVVITTSPRFTRALDIKTGKELWRFADETEVKVPTPITAHGLVFIAGGYPQGRNFFALNLDGTLAWRNEKGGPYVPTPIVYGDYLYVASDNGILGCYQAKTGKEVYRQRIAAGVEFSASPTAGDGKLYLASHAGDIHVVRAGPKFELAGKMVFEEALMATPAISNGVLYVRSVSKLYAIGNRRA
jgi:outer membrane protein assembly factor BamB